MTVLDTQAAPLTAELPATTPAPMPRPTPRRGRRPRADAADALRLEAQTIKAYRLADESRRTVGYLRRIVNQRHIPDDARITVDGERITIEWADA